MRRVKVLTRTFQIATLEKEVRERAKKDTQKEQTEAEAPMMNPGFNRLMLTNGLVTSPYLTVSTRIDANVRIADSLVRHHRNSRTAWRR
jgi:hypothetical protein